ncbi:MAG TPA: cyclic pyranopterin monophosphate synthase MoaC [Rhizorhapis sp.]|nr:cyclic pyranopterin monophosphate synthase MoaC [Rhizorhapis sp.]
MTRLTHLDQDGAAHMVDVSAKPATTRQAIATGRITMSQEARQAISEGLVKKGDVLAVARVAGIMAAKKTSELIPLCHPLPLSSVSINLELDDAGVVATATAKTSGQTGVEMEALTAVSTALLTVYDMAKAIDKAMIIADIHLLEKTGGKSGNWKRG